MNWWASALVYGRMIKFSHSIFALPFAFSGAVAVSITNMLDGSSVDPPTHRLQLPPGAGVTGEWA